jgi:hypothetical protein
MGQWDVYNMILLSLNENSSRFIEVKDDYDAVCQQLQVDNLVLSVIREDPGLWAPKPSPIKFVLYAIHPNGVKLIATLPAEYSGLPYDYFLKLKQDTLDADANFKQLLKDVNTANLASAKAIKSTAKWTLWLFIATTVMAIGTLVLAIYPLTSKSDVPQELQQLRDRIQKIEQYPLPRTPATIPDRPSKSQKLPLSSSKDSLKK